MVDPFTRTELQFIRDRADVLCERSGSSLKGTAYVRLAMAADHLDAMLARAEPDMVSHAHVATDKAYCADECEEPYPRTR